MLTEIIKTLNNREHDTIPLITMTSLVVLPLFVDCIEPTSSQYIVTLVSTKTESLVCQDRVLWHYCNKQEKNDLESGFAVVDCHTMEEISSMSPV